MSAFHTDGCTRWPDRWFGVDIWPCCVNHDVDYWVQDTSKWASDARLARCVARQVGGPKGLLVAGLMWLGVSTFGWRYWLRGKRGERPKVSRLVPPVSQRKHENQHQGGPGGTQPPAPGF